MNKNKSLGIFDELRIANNNLELSNKEKDNFLKEIDTKQNQEGFYLDAFDNPISFNGIRQLKKPYTKMSLNKYQQQEIKACQEDYYYFRRNYCKIVSKSGVDRPEPRGYQKRLEDELVSGEDVLAFWPRQCISKDTKIEVNNKIYTIEEVYSNKYSSEYIYPYNKIEKFISTRKIEENLKIKTNNIDSEIIEIHKTIPFKKYKIILENGLVLEGAEHHIVIDKNYEEIHLINSLGNILITSKGLSKVIDVIDTKITENMYDISINSKEQLYFSNNILSHNSGKSVTISIYLLWKAITTPNINIGIAANVQKLAVEVLDKIRKIYMELPVWLQPGLIKWNQGSIEFDNGTKIMTAATNGDSFRGFSIHLLYIDEVGFIKPNIWLEFSDSVFPAQEALAEKQTICSSTSNGLNHWYNMVQGARKPFYRGMKKDDIIILNNKEEVTVQEYYNTQKDINEI